MFVQEKTQEKGSETKQNREQYPSSGRWLGANLGKRVRNEQNRQQYQLSRRWILLGHIWPKGSEEYPLSQVNNLSQPFTAGANQGKRVRNGTVRFQYRSSRRWISLLQIWNKCSEE